MSALTDMAIWSKNYIAETYGITPELLGIPREEVPSDDPEPQDA